MNYPPGAQYDPRAPYNEIELEPREIEVTVSLTLSKDITVKVNDYRILDEEIGDDGKCHYLIDYSDCNLEEAVQNQYYLPYEAGNILKKYCNDSSIINDLDNWCIDDYTVNYD